VLAHGGDHHLARQVQVGLGEAPQRRRRLLDVEGVELGQLGVLDQPAAGLGRDPAGRLEQQLAAAAVVGDDRRPLERGQVAGRRAMRTGLGAWKRCPHEQAPAVTPPTVTGTTSPPSSATSQRTGRAKRKPGAVCDQRMVLGKGSAATRRSTRAGSTSRAARAEWRTRAVTYSPLSVVTRRTASSSTPLPARSRAAPWSAALPRRTPPSPTAERVLLGVALAQGEAAHQHRQRRGAA